MWSLGLPEGSTLLSAAEAGEPMMFSKAFFFNLLPQWCVLLDFVNCADQSTSDEVCPCLVTPGWSWGLLMGTGWRGAGLPRTTELGVDETEETEVEVCCGSWLCWIKAAESGVSCLKAGRLL